MWGAALPTAIHVMVWLVYQSVVITLWKIKQNRLQEIQWYRVMAPALLLILTRIGVPLVLVLVLSVSASTFVLEKMLVKS